MHSLHATTRPIELRSARTRRSALLVGVSSVAAAAMLMLAPHKAYAQASVTGRAFEADPSSITGSVTLTRSDTQDVVRVNSAEAIITWDPLDTAIGGGPINILPQNNTLQFAGDGGFTVLNRVIPTDQSRAIQFNGNVISTVSGVLGGNVWFYSPGGIIAGPTARFAVGGLVLTSSTLNGIDKSGTELNFLGARSDSAIDIQPGAAIFTGDYVVLWAPRVQQGGTIISGFQTGGNVSLVGAESGFLTVTGGLFDMTINVGTDDPNGVVHTGTTTGQTPVNGLSRAITLATVAKNDFVNMLVGGNIGYADASVASASNGSVILTSGSGTQPASGNITINPTTFNSTTIAQASGDLTIALSGIGNNLNVGSATNEADFVAVAGDQLSISAVNGASLLAFDNFAVGALVPGQGGTVSITVDDAGRNDDSSFSGLIVGGNLIISAAGNGVDNIPLTPIGLAAGPTVGGDGVGGTINIDVSQGGELLVGGNTTMSAGATGGIGSLRSGSATGGAVNFDVSGNNTRIIFTGNVAVDTSANRSAAAPVNSGTFVTAGDIDLNFTSGAISFNNLNPSANADADDSIVASGRPNGAQAGSITLTNSARLSGAAININAQGLGANAGASLTASDTGGDGLGGTVLVENLTGGSLTVTALGINANGSGGVGGNGSDLIDGGRGGIGSGGSITVSNAGTLVGNPVVTLSATGTGGAGGTGGATPNDFDPAADGGDAGAGQGGAISLIADGAATAVQVGSTINASGTGGTGGTGGTAPSFVPGDGGLGGAGLGGDIALRSINGGALTLATTTGTTTLDSRASGGVGGNGGIGPSVLGDPGGNGSTTGGTVDVLATESALTVTGNLIANASANGNRDLRTGATGADATGGTITVSAQGGGDLTISGGLWLNATALAAIGELSAGTGRGGTANLLMSGTGSSFDLQGRFPLLFANPPRGRSLFVDTSAYEPQSGAPLLATATGGNTFGGAINLAFTGGTSTISGTTDLRSFSAVLNPLSGSGAAPDQFINGAIATGGTIAIALANGTHTWGTLNGSVSTFGFGGSAINGSIRASLDNATLNLVTTPGGVGSLGLDTYVGGETAQSAADAVVLRLINGSTLSAEGGISLFADAGHGISGNTITTGNVRLELDGSDLSVGTGNIFLGNEAQAFRFPGTATNTTGADAIAGDITIRAVNGSTIDGNVQLSSSALADAGDNGGDARSGNLGYALDGSTHTGNIAILSFAEGQGAGDVSGTGGTTTGGNQSITLANGASFTGDIDLETTLRTYHAGAAQGAYGLISGGAATLSVTGSNANIGVINAQFNGAADPAVRNFAGADISAGSLAISAVGSTLSIGDASISLDATGGVGGQGARGGNGTGGTISITSDATSALTLNDVVFSADGSGGAAGDAAPEEDGPAGGTGAGGRISVTTLGDVTINSMFADATGRGGDGGAGVSGQLGGIGGTGQGGTAELEFSAAPTVTTVLGSISLDSSATGGTGGTGGGGNMAAAATGGGSGGVAFAGTTRLRVTGNGAVLAFDPAVFGLASAATGGVGGRGGANFNGGVAGRGGDGGNGTGGRIALEAGSGATLTLDGPSGSTFVFQVTGTGGAGGAGGNIDMINGGTAGDGGNGGEGTGGSPTLRAVGGRIIAPDIHLLATGTGGAGGIGGDEGTVVLGATGNGGLGRGGTPLLQTLDGSPGVLTLGTVLIDASGIGGGGTIVGTTAGGQITITDASADPAGLITMGSLTVTALGAATAGGIPSLTVAGDSGPITVTGAVDANVGGSINFAFTGSGQLDVGGSTTLDAGGDITLAHTGNTTGVVSLDIGTDLIATAGGNFVAGVGSIIAAGRDVSITAQNIQFASTAAVRDLRLTANNGSISGVGTAVLAGGGVTDLNATQAIAIGDIASDLSIELTAGTTITAGNLTGIGADTIGDERINIVAGGNVTLGTVNAIDGLTISGAGLTATSLDGQSVTALMTGAVDVGAATAETTIALSGTSLSLDSGDAVGNITLTSTAGAMALGTINSETDLLATATGDIAFTNLTGRVVTLNSGGTITGGSVAADRNVASGVSRNVNLTAVGGIALANASAVADIVIRGASLTATSLTSGTGLTDDIDVLVSGAVGVGASSSGGQTSLVGSAVTLGTGIAGGGTSLLRATSGAVDVTSFDSQNFLDIVSATTAGFGTLTARALSITATGNVTGTRAETDVNQVSGRPRNVEITTDGAIAVTTVRAVNDVILSGGSIDVGTLNARGRASLAATGLVAVDILDSLIATTINAGSADIGVASSGVFTSNTTGQFAVDRLTTPSNLSDGSSADDISVTAGGAINFGTINGSRVVRLNGASVNGGAVIAAAALDIDSGSVNLTRAEAGNGFITIDTTAGGVSVDELVATTFGIIVNSAGGFASNTIDAGGSFQLDAVTSAALGVVNAGNAISATAGGNITADDLFAGTTSPGVTLRAGGTATLANVTTNGLIDIAAGGALTGGVFSSRGQITLRAASIDITSAVSSLVGGAFLTSTTGNVSADLLQTNGGAIEVVSAGEIDLAELTTQGAIRLTSAGNATLGTANSGGQMALTIGGNLVAGNLTGASPSTIGIVMNVAGDAQLASVNSGGLLDINVGGALTGDNLTAFGLLTVDAASIDLADVVATGSSVAITSTTGNVSLGDVTGGIGSITINSAAALNAAALDAVNAVRVTSALDAVMTTVDAGGQVLFAIGGNLTAGDIAGASPSTIGVQLGVGGNAVLGAVQSGGLLDVDVAGALTGADFSGFGPVSIDAGSIAIANVGSDLFGVALRTTTGAIATAGITAPGSILVNAAGAATLGALDTDIGLQVTAGGNTTIASANAVTGVVLTITGNLTTGAVSASDLNAAADINATGSAQIASLTSGGLIDVDLGGALTGGSFDGRGALTIDAASIDIDSANSTALGVALRSLSGAIAADSLTAAGSVLINSAAGATLGALDAGANMVLTAGGNSTIGSATADGNLTVNITGNLTSGALLAGTGLSVLDLNVSGNAQVASARSGSILDANVGGALSGGAFASGSATLVAASIDLVALAGAGAGGVTATAGSGGAAIGTVTSGGDASVNALLGAVTVGTLNTALSGRLTGTSVALNQGTVGTDLVATATAGNITGSGAITVGGLIDLGASGNVGFGTLAAQGGAFTVDAGGDITFTGATSIDRIAMIAGGDILGGNLSAPNAIQLSAARIAIGNAVGGTIGLTSTSDILFDRLQSVNPLTLIAANGAITANTGAGDIASGGDVSLTAQTIAIGAVTSGASISANATVGNASFGALSAVDTITVTAIGTPTIASLASGGDTSITGAGIALNGGTIGGSLSLDATAGDIALALDGSNQIVVGGATNLNASGDIRLSHTNNSGGTVSLSSNGNLRAFAGGAIRSEAGSILSGSEVRLLSGGAVNLADVRAVPALIITAGGSVDVRDASVTGPQGTNNVAGILIDAGLSPFGSTPFDNLASARITGTVQSYAGIEINAGGNAVFAPGSQVLAGDRIIVRSGDDIVVAAGAVLQSARAAGLVLDPAAPFADAGSINLHTGGVTNLLSTPATPISSLVVDGLIDAGRGAVLARANAIDGLDGRFAGSSLSFDIDDAPPAGSLLSNDNGLLLAPCLEGRVCLGGIAASNILAIGQASNNDVLSLLVEQGTVNAREIRITTRDDIVMGTNGIATTLNASDLFSATSRTGDVDLRDAAITSDRILIEAAGSLLGGASLTSANDIGITVGDSLSAASINTGGELTTVADVGGAPEGFYSVPGSITVGTLSVGTGNIDYSAGGSIDLGSVTVPSSDIRLSAGGAINVGFTNGAANIGLFGGSVSAGSLDAGGLIEIESGSDVSLGSATAGGELRIVLPGELQFATLSAGTVDASAGGAINGGDLSGGTVRLSGGSIAIGSANVAEVDFTSQTDIRFDALQSTGAVALSAANGAITNNGGAGDLTSDGNVTLLARSLDLGSLQSGGTASARATAGDARFTSITAATDARVAATGNVVLGTFSAGRDGDAQADSDRSGAGNLTITSLARAVRNLNLFGANVSLADVAVTGVTPAPTNRLSGFVTINSTNGSVNVGNVTAPGMTIVSEGGSLTSGALRAFDPVLAFGLPTVIDLSAFGGNITVASLDSVGDVTVFIDGGSLTRVLGSSIAGNDINFSGTGSFAFDGLVTAGRDVIGRATGTGAANVTFGAGVSIGRHLDVIARNGSIILMPASAAPNRVGGNLTFTAQQIDLSAVTIGGNLAMTATAGTIDANAVGSVGGAIALSASNDVLFGTLRAQNGNLAATAGGSVSFTSAEASGDVTLSGARIAGGDALAGRTLGLTAVQDITVGQASAQNGNLAATAGGSVSFTSARASDDVTLSAARIAGGDALAGRALGLTAVQDITVGQANAQNGNLVATAGGSLAFTSARASADVTLSGARIAGGDAVAGRALGLTAVQDITVGQARAQSGDLVANAGGSLGFTSAQASGDVTLSGARIAGGDAVAGRALGLTAVQDITLGQASAGSDVTARAGGAFVADRVSASKSGTGVVDLAAVNGIRLNTLVGNSARLAASGGAISVNVDIDMTGLVDASGQSVLLRSTNNLAASATASAGNIDIETTDDLDIRSAAAGAGDVRLASTGGVATVANVSAGAVSSGRSGNVQLSADENLNIAGPVTAAANLATRSGERTSIRAATVGRDIDLSASDLSIESTGSLGNFAATRSIEISGGSIARVGGAAGGDPAFVIDNSEFARIQSGGTIAISASTALILDDLDIAVAASTGTQGNLRSDGRIDFGAAEGIEVVGEVVMTGATANNALGLTTRGDVYLDASSGLLEISDASGVFLGTIEVEASNFYALTEQALTDVEAATSITQIDERLALNDGIDNPEGLIRTGTLDIMTVTSDVFIQNTAPGTAFAERRGFTVNELLISDPAGTNQPIVINGIIDGQTGVDAVSLAQISSAFDPGSTINGCLIANTASCTVIPSHSDQSSPPVQDLIEGQLDEGTSEAGETITAGLLDTPLFELKDPADTSEDPLLDDPVTGAGNEDLWVGECEGEAADNGQCTVPAE